MYVLYWWVFNSTRVFESNDRELKTKMTTLAEDIKALMDLGHTLERATDLATQDRAKSVGKKASIPPFTSHHIFSAVNNLPLTSFLLFYCCFVLILATATGPAGEFF